MKNQNGKYGQMLSIKVPDGKGQYAAFPNLQQPAPGVFSALAYMGAKISLKKGKKSLIWSVGVATAGAGEHPFKAVLKYWDNPTPPATSTATAIDGAALLRLSGPHSLKHLDGPAHRRGRRRF